MSPNWKSSLLDRASVISDAVRCLESADLKLVLVVDQDEILVGTITDGDIRRGLLEGIQLTDNLEKVINFTPVVVHEDAPRHEIARLRSDHDVVEIPVVDNKNRVIGVEISDSDSDANTQDNPVLVMAGGYGRRLHPLTEDLPKPMLAVGGKPILESIISQLTSAGFKRIFISTHYQEKKIRDHFGSGIGFGAQIEYLHESVPLGTAGAIGSCVLNSQRRPLLIINGDILTTVSFGELLSFHESQGNVMTVCGREYKVNIPYGELDLDGHSLLGIIEKPTHRVLVNAGIYVVNAEIYTKVRNGEKLDMPELIKTQLDANRRVGVFPIHEYWLDIGEHGELEKARQYSNGSRDV